MRWDAPRLDLEDPGTPETVFGDLVEALHEHDPHNRLRLYHPFTAGGQPIYVHAKVTVVDDEVLRVGSSNFNNRSLRLDSECDVVIDAARDRIEERGLVRRERDTRDRRIWLRHSGTEL